jgi:hypothetical protein
MSDESQAPKDEQDVEARRAATDFPEDTPDSGEDVEGHRRIGRTPEDDDDDVEAHRKF